jgi:hypothetical protein
MYERYVNVALKFVPVYIGTLALKKAKHFQPFEEAF